MGAINRGGSRTAASSKMEHFVMIVDGCKPLTVITKCSILDVAAVLDPPLTFSKRRALREHKSHFRERWYVNNYTCSSLILCLVDNWLGNLEYEGM